MNDYVFDIIIIFATWLLAALSVNFYQKNKDTKEIRERLIESMNSFHYSMHSAITSWSKWEKYEGKRGTDSFSDDHSLELLESALLKFVKVNYPSVPTAARLKSQLKLDLTTNKIVDDFVATVGNLSNFAEQLYTQPTITGDEIKKLTKFRNALLPSTLMIWGVILRAPITTSSRHYAKNYDYLQSHLN